MMNRFRKRTAIVAGSAALLGLVLLPAAGATAGSSHGPGTPTTTPIKHLVVIFDENVSFDHYFGTYPYATNPVGSPAFNARTGTPTVNGLYNQETGTGPTGPLLTNNPNGSNPVLLQREQAMTCDQDHGYTAEQSAADHGTEDEYPANTGNNLTLDQCLNGFSFMGTPEQAPPGTGSNAAVLSYYDGNTVTGLWNLAQHFSLADNFYGTTYGPSTPGALNVTSAQTYGTICGPSSATINDSPCSAPPGLDTTNPADSTITTSPTGPTSVADQPAAGPGTTYSDADPTFDICSYLPSSDGGDGHSPASTLTMGGNNIGQELTTAGLTWGWFEGGFDDGYVPGHGTPPTTAQICSQSHTNVGGSVVTDYIPHHEPFEYYASTANPMHLPPTSVAMIGRSDQANHQYDTADFWAAAYTGHMPQVSFLKAPAYQDGHAGYSDPVDEQTWLATTLNRLQSLPSWKSTAVVITWDDSDGWYDHVLGPVQTQSQTSLDTLTATGQCGAKTAQVPVNSANMPEQGKCGLGPRLPMLVVSPYSKSNYVDNLSMDQSSVVSFIEQNWSLPAMGNGAADTSAGTLDSMFNFNGPTLDRVFLDPATGEVIHHPGYY